ncbi:MAG: carboxypeptidase-like regulatory domain-containing protein [Bacteroidales bacterium]
MLVFSVSISNAQDIPTVKVSGTVSDAASKDLIPGASVLIKGTQNGTMTDVNGKYSLKCTTRYNFVFSFIGFENQEVIVGTENNIDVSLKAISQAIEGVVVIGYGTTTKRSYRLNCHV